MWRSNFSPPQILSIESWEEADASRTDRAPSLCGTSDRCRLALEAGEWPPSRLHSHGSCHLASALKDMEQLDRGHDPGKMYTL